MTFRVTFPSPSGTIYSSIAVIAYNKSDTVTVSVPFGDYLFLNYKTLTRQNSSPSFRPLRGLSIPQSNFDAEVRDFFKSVSVPFGDYLFLNASFQLADIKAREEFPSPSGTIYSSIYGEKNDYN